MVQLSSCKQCKRLAKHLKEVQLKYPAYYCKPVPSFGDEQAQLLIIGLAPGLHGANATGRPFTGDDSGGLLFSTLYLHGFSSLEQSLSIDDGLQLKNCKIINAVKCLPPQNKPTATEINTCNQFLIHEITPKHSKIVILCLGQIAHKAVLKAKKLATKEYPFAHHAIYRLDENTTLIDSYHCGRYNTQTKRLTVAMFNELFLSIKKYI